MKFSILSICLLTLFTLTSCQKSDFSKDKSKEDYKKDKEVEETCFGLVYPVTYILPDNSTIAGEDEKIVWEAIKAWYNDHPEVEEKPILQYPVSIIFKDGSTETIADEAAMIVVKENCDDEGE